MSFRGELREFELPDILQLISSQQKAGWLKVIWKGNCQFVFFRDGKITSTKNPAEEAEPLEDFVLKRGYLTEDQSDRVAAARRKSGMDFHDVLRKEGFFTPDEIQEIFDSMVEQAIFELMSVKSGQYEFETEERPEPLPDGALSAEIGPILMEGARKADEVGEMRRFLGGENATVALSPAGRAAEAPSKDERAILDLVNGVRTIDTVIEDSGLDLYTATRTLFGCARKGWVTQLRRADDAASEEIVATAFDAGKTLRWSVPVLALLAAAFILTGSPGRFHGDDPLVGEWLIQSARLQRENEEQSIRTAVEAYRVKNGRYPAALEAVVGEGLLPESSLNRHHGPAWDYSLTTGGSVYVLGRAADASGSR